MKSKQQRDPHPDPDDLEIPGHTPAPGKLTRSPEVAKAIAGRLVRIEVMLKDYEVQHACMGPGRLIRPHVERCQRELERLRVRAKKEAPDQLARVEALLQRAKTLLYNVSTATERHKDAHRKEQPGKQGTPPKPLPDGRVDLTGDLDPQLTSPKPKTELPEDLMDKGRVDELRRYIKEHPDQKKKVLEVLRYRDKNELDVADVKDLEPLRKRLLQRAEVLRCQLDAMKQTGMMRQHVRNSGLGGKLVNTVGSFHELGRTGTNLSRLMEEVDKLHDRVAKTKGDVESAKKHIDMQGCNNELNVLAGQIARLSHRLDHESGKHFKSVGEVKDGLKTVAKVGQLGTIPLAPWVGVLYAGGMKNIEIMENQEKHLHETHGRYTGKDVARIGGEMLLHYGLHKGGDLLEKLKVIEHLPKMHGLKEPLVKIGTKLVEHTLGHFGSHLIGPHEDEPEPEPE